jgi:signal transduction histidine kinase
VAIDRAPDIRVRRDVAVVADVLVGAVLVAASIPAILMPPDAAKFGEVPLAATTPLGAIGLAIGLLAICVLPLRHRAPDAVLLTAALGAGLAIAPEGVGLLPLHLALPIAAYAAVVIGRRAVIAWATLATVAPTVLLTEHPWSWLSGFLPLALVGLAAWAAAEVARGRALRTAAIEARERDLREHAIRLAEEAARDERDYLSRELHDTMAHALSAIVVQAQGALSALDRDAIGDAHGAASAIVVTGREALSDLRRVLSDEGGSGAGPARVPQPGIDDLPRLVERMRGLGTRVEVETTGVRRAVPSMVDLSVYRIVQECLTNVLRHAGPDATAKVGLDYGEGAITVTVESHGAALPGTVTPGRGLTGMRERVRILGGELVWREAPAGGLEVHARLPLSA